MAIGLVVQNISGRVNPVDPEEFLFRELLFRNYRGMPTPFCAFHGRVSCYQKELTFRCLKFIVFFPPPAHTSLEAVQIQEERKELFAMFTGQGIN